MSVLDQFALSNVPFSPTFLSFLFPTGLLCSFRLSPLLLSGRARGRPRRPGNQAGYPCRKPGAGKASLEIFLERFTRFLGHRRAINKSCFLGHLPEHLKSENRWPQATFRSISGPNNTTFGMHFGIDFSNFSEHRVWIIFSKIFDRILDPSLPKKL